MWFPAALIITTILTVALIFGVYKIFLDKPAPPTQVVQASATPTLPTAERNPSSKSLASLPKSTSTATPSKQPSTKPSPSTKAIIGSLTVLQNNLSGQSSIAGSSTISGSIDMLGTVPSGTSMVIVARKSGTSDQFLTVVDGITPQDNQGWAWNTAQNGVSYDMLAILKGSSGGVNTDYAKSQIYIVKAPAYQQIFAVDAGFTMTVPTGTITTTCTTHNANNTWAATVNFPSVTGAQSYSLQVGTASGQNDLFNVQTSGYTQSTTLNDSAIYYAQYATASVNNPTSAQFSPYSTPQQIKCP